MTWFLVMQFPRFSTRLTRLLSEQFRLQFSKFMNTTPEWLTSNRITHTFLQEILIFTHWKYRSDTFDVMQLGWHQREHSDCLRDRQRERNSASLKQTRVSPSYWARPSSTSLDRFLFFKSTANSSLHLLHHLASFQQQPGPSGGTRRHLATDTILIKLTN